MRHDLPSGTVTFLFTDVEGSTRLLHELGAEGYAEALAEHRRLIREACARHGGVEVDTQGDAFFFAFPSAPGAIAAAGSFTEALASDPIQVRVGLHTGTPLLAEEGYVGHDVHLAARVAASGHGGQVLVSKETASLLSDAALTSLGSHRLKDIADPVFIFQLGERSFPPLKTIANSNLPTPASSFLGREEELYAADLLLRQTRLLTVTGPGGQGKTRFSLELARRAREERFSDYPDGVFASFFSSLRDPTLVLATIATTLNVREQPGQTALQALTSHLEGKQLLVLLDNLEHLLDSAPELSRLLSACPGLTLLVTSRELLRIGGEHPYDLPPLQTDEGVSLFCARSQLEPSETIRELCARLEGLPLAIELAAARTRIMTPEQLLDRLSSRLDLLKGGRDADPRQATLRATIEWSYDLLTPEEQTLFARLSVFAGGCTLEAAEEVCDADLDSLQSLVDKSLLRFTEGRYWLLETIREFAAERLEEAGEGDAMRGRHAGWGVHVSTAAHEGLRGTDQGQWFERLASEENNLIAAMTWLSEAQRGDDLVAVLFLSRRYWEIRSVPSRLRTLYDRAGVLTQGQRTLSRARGLYLLAEERRNRGKHDEAIGLARESLSLHRACGDEFGTVLALFTLGAALRSLGRLDDAQVALEEALGRAKDAEEATLCLSLTGNLGDIAMSQHDYELAILRFEEALAGSRALNQTSYVAWCLSNLGFAYTHVGRLELARDSGRESVELCLELDYRIGVAYGFYLLSSVEAELGRREVAARLLGAADALREELGLLLDPAESALADATRRALRRDLGDDVLRVLTLSGADMTLGEAVTDAFASID